MKRCLPFILFWLLLPIAFFRTSGVHASELRLLATTFPMYHLARHVVEGQEGILLSQLLPAQTGCPHDYVLTPQDMRKLAGADVLLVNGLGLEEFLGAPVMKVNPGLKLIDASEGMKDILPSDTSDSHRHDAEDRHLSSNPHLFASPRMMACMATTLAEKLAKIFPEGAEQFRRNAKNYAGDLNSLADQFAELGRKLKNNRIVTQHDVFAYLARDAGLEVVATIQTHAGQEPSAAELLQLIRTIQKTGAGAIFTEPPYPDKIGRTLSRETGIPAAVLDPVASGPEEADRNYYLNTMRANLAILEESLGIR